MNDNEQSVRIPFPSASNPSDVTNATYAELFQNIKNDAIPGLSERARRGRIQFLEDEARELQPGADYEVIPGVAPSMAQPELPGAPGPAPGPAPLPVVGEARPLESMSVKQLKALARSRNLGQGGNKEALIARLRG